VSTTRGTGDGAEKSRKRMAVSVQRPPLNLAALRTLATRTVANWSEDAVPRLAAAFSFYAVLSLAPLLVLAIVAAGYFFESADVRSQLLSQVQGAIGKEGRDLIGTLIENTYKPGASTIATLLSLAVTFFSASGLFIQLNDALNTMWGITADPKQGFFRSFLLTRVFAFISVLVFGVIILGWLAIDAWLQWLQKQASAFAGWTAVSVVVSAIFLLLVFAVSYKSIPKGHVKWQDVWVGASVAALGITIAKYLLSLYFSYAHVAGAFGPAGALVLILLWIYYTSQIYFFGAEIVYSYAHLHGSRSNMQDNKELTYS
jgi:membrane protein